MYITHDPTQPRKKERKEGRKERREERREEEGRERTGKDYTYQVLVPCQ